MKGKRILVVEDDADISELLEERLKNAGYEIFSVRDGHHALKAVVEKCPDLIILDLFLPTLSGEEVCKSVREHDNDKVNKIPILMLSAKASEVDKIVGRVIGANRYLTKPLNPQELLTNVDQLLTHSAKL